MKVGIVIPVYLSQQLHVDFTKEAIASLRTSHEKVVIVVDNYAECEDYRNELYDLADVYIKNQDNILARAWNLGILEAIEQGCDYILIANNDIILHPQAIDNLVEFAQTHPEFILWSGAEYADMRSLKVAQIYHSFDDHPHFSCFLIKADFPEVLGSQETEAEPKPGLFDETFAPAYFEDGDMHNRILRANFKAGKTASALFYHYGSRTIKVDPDLNLTNGITYEKNRNYFQRKWGFDPHGTVVTNDDPIRFKFKRPFENELTS